MAVGEEVGSCAVDELVTLLSDLGEVGGDDALAEHASCDRDLLEVDVVDAFGFDPLGQLLDLLASAGSVACLLKRLWR
uniref:Unannotated protein n=1 Tax=freshwater metagenome TaxID=449393 RepID=A0A6J5Z4J7_9ZZZZ